MQGVGAGNYEFGTITNIGTSTLTLRETLRNTYSGKAQVVGVPHFQSVTVQAGGNLTARPWDGSTGGVVVFKVSNQLSIMNDGSVDARGIGFRGGEGGVRGSTAGQVGYQGESTNGLGSRNWPPNGSAGGGGEGDYFPNGGLVGHGGGGGSYQGSGGNGSYNRERPTRAQSGSAPGGPDNLSLLFLGAGGGGGGADGH
jgi:large repetitive protein